jgi:hypothetical protein
MIAWSSRGRHRRTPATAAVRPTAVVVNVALAASLVIALANFNGGYYPRAWGWGGLSALAVAVLALLASRRLDLSRREWLMLAATIALLVWILVTATRPNAATRAVPEFERGALYLAVLWAAMLVLRRDAVEAALGGLLTGIVVVCLRGLESYLFPGQGAPNFFEGRLLYLPLGYANAAGILAAMGIVVALGLAAYGGATSWRALAAGSLVPLVATLSFTASRGAVASLVLALGVMLALDPSRRRLAATAMVTLPLPLLAVWASSRTRLGDAQADPSLIAHDGRVIAMLIVLLTFALIVVSAVALRDGRGLLSGGTIGRVALWLSSFGGVAAVVAAVVKCLGGTLGDRPAYWHAAWADYLAHPLLGSGAGSFGTAWLQHRSTPSSTIDAHNLYLETLTELGPLGLALLLTMLAIPLTAALASARRQSLALPAVGVYVAFLAHAAVDWDWEMPAVTAVALVAGALLLVSARPLQQRSRAVSLRVVAPSVAGSVALAVVTAVALAGNSAFASAAADANSGSWGPAQRRAQAAARWEPWSAEPRFLLGEAQLAVGDHKAARQSFAQALALDSDDWRTWYELARVSGPDVQRIGIEEIAHLNPMSVRLLPSPAHLEGRTRNGVPFVSKRGQ